MTKKKVTEFQAAEETLFLNKLYPYFREVQAHSGRILVYVLPAILGAFVINIPRFFDVLKVNVCEDYTHCGCGIVLRSVEKINIFWYSKSFKVNHIIMCMGMSKVHYFII